MLSASGGSGDRWRLQLEMVGPASAGLLTDLNIFSVRKVSEYMTICVFQCSGLKYIFNIFYSDKNDATGFLLGQIKGSGPIEKNKL